MKHSVLALSALALFSLNSAHATTIGFGAVPTARQIVDALNGTTPIAAGSLVWVGNFANESFVFDQNLTIQQNVNAITAAGVWRQFSLDTATNTVNSGATNTLTISGTQLGRAGGSVTDNNTGATKADFFNGKNVYLWVFNATTTLAATQMGIFRATTATVPWTFATNAGGVGDGTTLSTTQSAAPTIVSVGNAGTIVTGAGTSADPGKLRLVASVPEPSSLLLCGLAGLGMLSGRNRRRNA